MVVGHDPDCRVPVRAVKSAFLSSFPLRPLVLLRPPQSRLTLAQVVVVVVVGVVGWQEF